jgi:FkbM family methyltransferase
MKRDKLLFTAFYNLAHFLKKHANIHKKVPYAMGIYNFLYSNLAPKNIELVEVLGQKMYLDLRDSIVAAHIYMEGVHEKGTTYLFKNIVNEGMVVVDIGAYIGYYTLLAADRVGQEGKVFAFEPCPYSYSLLVKNINVNGYNNVIPVQKAIVDRPGIADLFLDSENFGGHSLASTHNKKKSITVETTSLNEFFKNKEYLIDVIKMDVEGAEMAVLKGMNKIIEKNRDLKIITEFDPLAMRRFGFSPKEFLKQLARYGFKLHIIKNHEAPEPTNVARIMKLCKVKGHINLFCEKKTTVKV